MNHDWIQTFAGIAFDLRNPRAEDVFLLDIAHALSMLCRYTGHTDRFYSVAEHCVHVSRCVPAELAAVGLMHDAAEAYIGDVSRPLKRMLPEYKAIEARVEAAIAERFGLAYPLPAAVKDVDTRMLRNEREALLNAPPATWSEVEHLESLPDVVIFGWTPWNAEKRFRERAAELGLR